LKWYNSLITKISLIFAIALFGIIAIVFAFNRHELEKKREELQRYTKAIVRPMYKQGNRSLNLQIMSKAGFKLVTDKKLKREIFHFKQPPRDMTNRPHIRVITLIHHGTLYIIVENRFLFEAPQEQNKFAKIVFLLGALLFIVFLYIATIRSILPLYSLRRKVKEFADGNYEVDCKSNKKDEIAILSNEFDKSVKKIKKLRDSRQLFLRNIMHELKTPITKGKLSCAMIEESSYSQTLKNVFKRQEVLLNEFARIEKLSANEIALSQEDYSLQDIVDYALDIIAYEEDSITCKLTPMSLHIDFELFGTALKNLIDNAIKYSDDSHVLIESNQHQIIISNKAQELEFPLERYEEPYFLEGKKQKSSRGLGFGLFITTNIIKLHNMKIEYNRKKDRNVFIINVKKDR